MLVVDLGIELMTIRLYNGHVYSIFEFRFWSEQYTSRLRCHSQRYVSYLVKQTRTYNTFVIGISGYSKEYS